MKPTLYIFDEDPGLLQALDDYCAECRGRGCTNCLPARPVWQPAASEVGLDHDDRTPPLAPDRVHALDRQPVPAGAAAAGGCDPIHPPGWLISAEPVIDRDQAAAEVLRILAAARKDSTR
ncbi:hypothetical protein [Actinomadura sp. WMMA1423]|uniref:hypothetical protein n=1 Tax=Actinomadura sp. WMMA1423 TaxID=2591108 RepID=UPI001146D5AC|nr:hypothetical protein [Actinomadura sp. WMMA1423]